MASKIRNTNKNFNAPVLPMAPAEYSQSLTYQRDSTLRIYFNNIDDAITQALQYDSDDIIDGSIPNSKLENFTVSFGGVTLPLGGSDATPAFDLSDATGYPTSSLVGTITTAQIADDAVTAAKLADSINSAIAANTAKVTNATHTGEVTGATALTITDGAVATAKIADDAVTAAKLVDSINSAIAANTAKVTNATHTGEVTGDTALTITDGAVATAKIADLAVTGAKIANSTITYLKMGTSSVGATAIQSNAVTTTKIANQNVTGIKIAAATIGSGNMASGSIYTGAIQDDAVTSAKITGPFSSKHAFSTVSSQNITTTAAVTIYEPDIPAPPGGNEATQSLNAAIRIRFYNSSSSAVKENHQWKMPVAIKSKTNVGTSLGTATYSSSPSSYNAWYYVSGDKTSIFATNRGGFSTNTTGANNGSFAGLYYDSANDRTYIRVSKFPDATTVYNGVEVFYSTVNFASSGTFVNNLGFNNNFLTIGSTTAYQTIEFPLVFTFGRSTTATEVRIQFDHISSTTNLSTVITGINGYVENTV